jgi:large subunit ribosomal protein L30
MGEARKVKIKLVKSLIGRPEKHGKVARALGLYKTNEEVILAETPLIAGNLRKISHLITVEAV